MKHRANRLPEQSELHRLLVYDALSGVFVWRKSSKRAGYIKRGRIQIVIYGLNYFASRVAWKYVYGTDPIDVDHANNNSLDDRIDNLREATLSQNQWNKTIQKNNTSGFKGVYRSGLLWRAQIYVHGKKKHLGYFSTPECAHESYCAAARNLHGAFACYGK